MLAHAAQMLSNGSTCLPLLPMTQSLEHVGCACQDGSLTVKVSLESNDGVTSYAATSFDDVDGEWRHYKATLTVAEEVLSTPLRGRIASADPITLIGSDMAAEFWTRTVFFISALLCNLDPRPRTTAGGWRSASPGRAACWWT